jgi:osmotically-inducible protein OsmY
MRRLAQTRRRPTSGDGSKNGSAAALERLKERLQTAGYASLRSLLVTVDAGCVRLSGRVPSYHLKQVAQSMALTHFGVSNVVNDLVVSDPVDSI